MNFNSNPILYPKDDGLKPSKDNGNPPCYPKEDGLNPFKAIVERINTLESVTRNYGDSFETKELTVTENAQIKNLNATEGTVNTLNSTNCNIKNAQIENLRTNRLTWDSPSIDVENAEVEKLNVTTEIKVENFKTEEPIFSNAVVGYDENGKMIPIKIAELEEKVDKDLANATGTLPVANGGTGATTAKGAQNALLSDMQTETTAIDDSTEFVMKYGTPTDTKGALFKRSATLVWNYIKGKISSVLGLTKDTYGGKASTAGKASFLDEYPGAGSTRLTSGNIVPKDASEYGGMRKDVVTSSMTDSGRPGTDGHLLTMFWDNPGRYDSQFFVSNNNPLTVKARTKANGADYGPWVDIATSAFARIPIGAPSPLQDGCIWIER